jgi:hypothetical protein
VADVRADRAAGITGIEFYDYVEAVVELAGGRPNTIDRLRVDEGDYIRAAGDVECTGTRGFSCGLPYYDHPVVPGFEWLHRTCDGRFVKL